LFVAPVLGLFDLEACEQVKTLVDAHVTGLAYNDPELVISVFAPDAELGYDLVQLSGAVEIGAFFVRGSANLNGGPLEVDQRLSTTPFLRDVLIDVTGDEARARSRGFVVHLGFRDEGEVFVIRPPLCEDVCFRRDGEWKIATRRHPHPPWALKPPGEVIELVARDASTTSGPA
jgi:hypothetical protein